MLRNLVLSAAAAGVAAGLLAAALQHVTTTPIIIEAERYEAAAAPAHTHSALYLGSVTATHGESVSVDVTSAGFARTLQTSLATCLLGVGFASALLGAMVLAGRPIDGRTGLAFGAAGFAAVALAPSLGLPPELPGSAAADLADRQAWWLFAAAATAIGLGMLLLGRAVAWLLAGIVALAIPHIVGAPQAGAFASTAPAELAGHFAAASLVVAAIFWSTLGFASGAIYGRLSHSA